MVNTLKSLLTHMSDSERARTLIVVFVAETDVTRRQLLLEMMDTHFLREMLSGVIEIIFPGTDAYPRLDALRRTFNDTAERVRWRAKQCLDFALLMEYCSPRGQLYMQLEDDVDTVQDNALTVVEEFVAQQKDR